MSDPSVVGVHVEAGRAAEELGDAGRNRQLQAEAADRGADQAIEGLRR